MSSVKVSLGTLARTGLFWNCGNESVRMVRRARARGSAASVGQDLDEALCFSAALLVEQFLALVDRDDDCRGQRLFA